MKYSKELIEKAKGAASAEELLKLAKAENIEMTAEEAEKAYAQLNQSGELSDDELDNVSGGGCFSSDVNPSPSGAADTPEEVVFLYAIGQQVEVIAGDRSTSPATIINRFIEPDIRNHCFIPVYRMKIERTGTTENIPQYQIQLP